MVLKLLGSLLIFLCSAGIGLYYSRRAKDETVLLKEFYKSLLFLKGEICVHKSTLSEAFRAVGKKSDKRLSDLFFRLAGRLDNPLTDMPFQRVWEEELDRFNLLQTLTAEDMEILKTLGKTLGYLDLAMQENGLSLVLSELSAREHEAVCALKNKEKLYRGLSLLFACFVIVLLI